MQNLTSKQGPQGSGKLAKVQPTCLLVDAWKVHNWCSEKWTKCYGQQTCFTTTEERRKRQRGWKERTCQNRHIMWCWTLGRGLQFIGEPRRCLILWDHKEFPGEGQSPKAQSFRTYSREAARKLNNALIKPYTNRGQAAVQKPVTRIISVIVKIKHI